MIRKNYINLILMIIFLIPVSVNTCKAQPSAGSEYQVKSGFIYHFARFTQWPSREGENETSPFIICIASTYPETDSLFSLEKKVLRQRRFVVKKYESKADIETCHILFIASDDKNYILKKIDDSRGHNILTIGEEKEFAEMGGIISFFVEQKRLRFAVNLKAAKLAGLKFSAQLLMSAELIREEP
ncbi:YfiR-like (DUF4154) domain-containing protein [Desulfonema limicola]|uniref:YfiR-like (DUF4154) domain-containing protein n=1 Tax=Desulfonema limicola TaxID=45656 RepID=A0A975B574_9BACT|nr:YfiR family protein [Desulfonema limicola]QTA79010.1 YfiR-like (DUF4154) domain-containing protein [Desulfonema limicola]